MTVKLEQPNESNPASAIGAEASLQAYRTDTNPITSSNQEQTQDYVQRGFLPDVSLPHDNSKMPPELMEEMAKHAIKPGDIVEEPSESKKSDPDAERLAEELKKDHGDDVFSGDGKMEEAAEGAADRIIESGNVDKETFEQLIKAMVYDGNQSDQQIEEFIKRINEKLKEKGSTLELRLDKDFKNLDQDPPQWKEFYAVSLVDHSKDASGGKGDVVDSRKLGESINIVHSPPRLHVRQPVDGYVSTHVTYYDHDGDVIPF